MIHRSGASQAPVLPHTEEEIRERLRLLPHRKVVVLDYPTMQTCRLQATTSPGPTITKPDLDEVRDVKPKALRPFKVVVLD